MTSDLSPSVSTQHLLAEQERAGILLVRRDRELTQANERLQDLDEAKSNFITVAAHQLRTPLSGIKWTLNLLLKGELGSLTDEQKNFLMKAYQSNDRIIMLVNDMLGADRVESGRMHFRFEALALPVLIDEVLAEMAPALHARHLSVLFDHHSSALPPVRADAKKLRAAIQNILDNSCKYSHDGGTITVALSVDTTEHAMVVSFTDHGIGIPASQQKHIFERFFRAQNAVKMETDGSGLGLFIAKSIIEKQGGRIWFTSEEGQGSAFFCTIPLAQKEQVG